jgi:hypothetical protein
VLVPEPVSKLRTTSRPGGEAAGQGSDAAP